MLNRLRESRPLAIAALALATLLVVVLGTAERDPLPVRPETVAQMVYQANPFDGRNRTVTDDTAIREVIETLNDTERTPADRFDYGRQRYQILFIRTDGSLWLLNVCEDGLQVDQTHYYADCKELCAVLEETWKAQKAGEIE